MVEASRNLIMKELVKRGHFSFAGFIQNEIRATPLVLFRYMAKWYGMPYDDITKITKEFEERFEEKEYTGWLKEACEMFQFEWLDNWDRVEKRMGFCYKYANVPYNNGTAASGVIMIDGKVNVPIKNETVMYNGVDLEKYGYIKYDMLTVTTMDMIQHFYGIDYDWNQVDDPKVWDTICSGDTDFVFQFSSPGMRRIITETKPRTIIELAEINALYRPGPMEAGYVEKYIAIKTGQDPELSEEELIMQQVFRNVFGQQHTGLMIFQEDLMKVCTDCAMFNLTEADEIRRGMSKKHIEVLLPWKEKFVTGWNMAGDPNKVWEALLGFAKYAFNKSHSVAYAIIAYATAKLWTYQRDEVLEYCLNDGTKDDYTLAINKCKELRFHIDYPDIFNMGGNRFAIERIKGKGTVLRIPINEQKSFDSYVQFLFDDEINVASLIYKGVCDKLCGDRQALAKLATTVLSKYRKQALLMEPDGSKFTRLEDILNGLKVCGGLENMVKNDDGTITVWITRANGKKATEVTFHPNNSDNVRAQKVFYDLKMFGSVRSGVLSDRPDVPYTALEATLERIKQKAYDAGRGDQAYKRMKDYLENWMKERFPRSQGALFTDVYALVTDNMSYSRNTKLLVEFNDVSDIFYLSNEEAEQAIKQAGKNALVKMTLKYSPYINKRKEMFIYDFDIMELQVISI